MDDRNGILIEELEKRLLWYREEASAEEFDPEAVDAICTMLQKLLPEEKPGRTKEEVFEDIMRQIRLEEEAFEEEGENGGNTGERAKIEKSLGNVSEKKIAVENSSDTEENEVDKKGAGKDGGKRKGHFLRGKSGLRAALIFVAVAGIFFSLNEVTYARENKSLFTMFLEKVGWLEIEKEEGEESFVIDGGEREGEFFDSWAELDNEVKKKIIVPAYIPEGYSLYGIRCWTHNNRKELQANYYNQGNGHLLIEITLWADNENHYRENASDESTCMLLSEYSDENTLYYEAQDEYICLAFMKNSFYRISGNIVLEDMIKIREGLGDIR